VLPLVLSLTAGAADVISVLGLGGLFVAQATGNLVLLASHVVTGSTVRVGEALAVPIFIFALILTRLLAARLGASGRPSLRPLLGLQLLLLVGFLATGVAAAPSGRQMGPADVAVMLGVCAMAVQNGLVQLSLAGAPSTAVMTTNLTRLVLDVVEVLVGHDPVAVEQARRRAAHTWPAVVGFVGGAALGGAAFAIAGLPALVVPAVLGLLALALAPPGARGSRPSFGR
jgi:uncharacterized membrane protein YoaK (UPF0700 family)